MLARCDFTTASHRNLCVQSVVRCILLAMISPVTGVLLVLSEVVETCSFDTHDGRQFRLSSMDHGRGLAASKTNFQKKDVMRGGVNHRDFQGVVSGHAEAFSART